MNLGPLEIVVILVIALLVFGPKRLPEVGRQVGGALRELRRVQNDLRGEISAAMRPEPEPSPLLPEGTKPSPDADPDHEADHEPDQGSDQGVGETPGDADAPPGDANASPDDADAPPGRAGFEGPSGSLA